MGRPHHELTGQRFGRLVVVGRAPNKGKNATWTCNCDCGASTEVTGHSLTSSNTRSCGCLNREVAAEREITHGMSKTPTYKVWLSMIKRCTNTHSADYPRYGGRGIMVCDRWRSAFENFLADMGERPDGMSIDRFPNNDGNYEPGNCRWATDFEQARNTRTTKLTVDLVQEIHGRCEHGETQVAVAMRLGVSKATIGAIRIGRLWPDQLHGPSIGRKQ